MCCNLNNADLLYFVGNALIQYFICQTCREFAAIRRFLLQKRFCYYVVFPWMRFPFFGLLAFPFGAGFVFAINYIIQRHSNEIQTLRFEWGSGMVAHSKIDKNRSSWVRGTVINATCAQIDAERLDCVTVNYTGAVFLLLIDCWFSAILIKRRKRFRE